MMQPLWYCLLADGNPFSHMGRNFRGGSGRLAFGELAVLLVILVAIGGIVWLLVRHFNARDRVGYRSPRALFQELCQAHQLDRPQRQALKRLARQQQLGQPARLFLEPERLAEQCLHQSSPDARRMLQSLRSRLFGSLRAAEPQVATAPRDSTAPAP